MGFALSDMRLASPSFDNGRAIPARHAADGDNLSPALEWSGAPANTQAFALFCHDPDAPLINRGTYGFVHWVLYGIPASTTSLPEGVQDFTQGRNDMDQVGYGGPLPPEGHGRHHYFFWLLALDEAPELQPDLTLWSLLEVIEPHVIAMNRVMGSYER